jgi:hypothetical protein
MTGGHIGRPFSVAVATRAIAGMLSSEAGTAFMGRAPWCVEIALAFNIECDL